MSVTLETYLVTFVLFYSTLLFTFTIRRYQGHNFESGAHTFSSNISQQMSGK